MLVVRSTVENLNVFQVLSYPVRKTAVNDSEYILPLSVIDSDSSPFVISFVFKSRIVLLL